MKTKMRPRILLLLAGFLIAFIGLTLSPTLPKASAAAIGKDNTFTYNKDYTVVTWQFPDNSGLNSSGYGGYDLKSSKTNPLLYGNGSVGTCGASLLVKSLKATTGQFFTQCNDTKGTTVSIIDPNSGTTGTTSTTGTGTGTSTASGADINCGGLSLNWILCPIEEGLTSAIKVVDNVIVGLLEINTNSIFSSCTSSKTDCVTSAAYKSAWSSMRNIALALLVLAALVMIISQALGYDFVDAYTIRKVMPRLIAAAIGITLSWQLLQFFVNFTNDVGLGVRSLIYTPFAGLQQSIELGNAGGLLGLILLGAGVVLLGWGMLTFLVTALLAVLVAVLVLIVRQVLIIFLLLVAPLAIVAYILPNTKKMYDVWWDFFAKALLMFPLIMAFIATGRVFASVAATNAKAASFPLNAVDGVLAFVAYFAPYFLLPLTFRFAGGALRNIGGFVSDRHNGAFERLRKYRSNTASERYKRAQGQSLWDNNKWTGKQANKLASWGTSPISNAAYAARNKRGLRHLAGMQKRGFAVASAIEGARIEQSSKLFEELNKMGYNDKAYRLLSGQHNDLSQETKDKLSSRGLLGKAPTSLSDLQTMAGIMAESSTSDSERIGAQAIQGSMGRLATLYQDPEMTKASTQAAGILGLAAHGFASGEDLAGAGNALSSGGKDLGFAQSIVSQAQLLGQRSRPDTKPGYGVTIKGDQFVNGVSAEGGRADAVLDTLSAQDLAGAKGGAIEALKPTIYDRITGPARADQSNLSPAEKSKIKAKADAQKDQLYQWASPYSQASNDVKVRALQMIDELGLRQEFDETVNMRNLTPEQRAEMMRRTGQRPDEGNQTPGQGR